MEGERQNPWWGDPSFRAIPNTATEQDVRINHLHVDTSYAERDLDTASIALRGGFANLGSLPLIPLQREG
jgi:hypothetical protein